MPTPEIPPARSLMLVRTCLICLLPSIVSVAAAQDPFGGSDPFGAVPPSMEAGVDTGFGAFGQPDPALSSTAAPSTSERVELDSGPVVRMLQETPPKTPGEMAKGLTWMARIKRWDMIGRLLDSVPERNWNLEQMASLATQTGSGLWIKLRADEVGLTDPQKQLVSQIFSSPGKQARNPQWIDRWIDKLGSSLPSERRLAQLRLQDASMAAVERLVERLLEGDQKVAPIMLAGTVAVFGTDGIDALRAACMVGDPDRAARVFLALAELPGKEFAAELGAGLSNRILSTDAKLKLAEKLSAKYATLPSSEAVHLYLAKQFTESLATYNLARASSSDLPNLVWRLTPDRRSILLVEAPSCERELERLAQLAALRLQMSEVSNAEAVDCGAVLLQRAYQVNPQIVVGEVDAYLLPDFLQQPYVDETYWQAVFQFATKQQLHGAALRSLQVLSADSRSTPSTVDFLSDQLNDPRPMIRFVALEALASMDVSYPYRGAERAIETAYEMTRLDGGPHALIVGLQAELRQVAQQQIQMQTGAEVTTANSARGAILALDSESPIELVFIVDRVSDQSVYELLQRIRNTKKGQSLPIAVLTEELYSHERRLIDETPGVIGSVLSKSPDQMRRILDSLLATLDTQPLTASERAHFSEVAGSFLSRIVGDRERYAFYPLASWREHLVSTAEGMDEQAQVRILSGLGTADSQVKLVRLAGQSAYSEAERFAAATAFGESIQRFGMRMNRAQVQSCYDLYNRIGAENPTSVKSLGYILDIIEARVE